MRLYRVSFSGELGYEIHVPARYGSALWQELLAAGEASGIAPYGLESLLVLRLEKGYLHLGAETDGTTIPADVGWGEVAGRKKADFIGKRSLARPDNQRTDRLQLVGLTAADAGVLVAGAHLRLKGTRLGSDGWVTSAAMSPTLGRPIALAMLRGGRARLGESVTVHDLGREAAATVVSRRSTIRRASASMVERVRALLAASALPAGARVYGDLLRLTVLPPRTLLRFCLPMKSQKSLGELHIADREVPIAMNAWLGEDPVIGRIAPDAWFLSSSLLGAAELIDAVRTACGKRRFTVTDLSDANVAIAVEGPQSLDILVRGCAIDFAGFAENACTRTRFAQVPIVLRRFGNERFELLVDRSLARYLFDWLQDAAAGID